MRIDSHQFFTEDHPPAHLRPILARNRFDGSIVLEDGPLPLDDFIKGVIRTVDLRDPRLPERLDGFQQSPRFRGVRYALEEPLAAGFLELARRGIPLDLELQPHQLPLVPRIADRAPDLCLVLVDMANPPYGCPVSGEWALGLEAAARVPRVYCKASSLIQRAPAPWNAAHIRPFVQHALTVFGPGRVMFGSGWPSCLPAAGWKETLAAFTQSIGAQTMETREALLGNTAARFYGLGSAA